MYMEDLKTSEAWWVFRIQAELIDGIETLNDLGPAVSIFGSARLPMSSREPKFPSSVAAAQALWKQPIKALTVKVVNRWA